MKSIIIFGKGPSVSRCTPEFVNKYDDIAICNYPVFNDFFKNLIQKREIKYHFVNGGLFDDRFDNSFNNINKITGIYNCHYNDRRQYLSFLKNKDIFNDSFIREKTEKYLKENNFDFDPSTGTIGFNYIINTKLYNRIAIVGFDNYENNKSIYYYNISLANSKLKHTNEARNITKDGRWLGVNGHNPIITKKYYLFEINKNKNIQFDFITNMELEPLSNISIYNI
tara:strand:+ start:7680 stop:8354 length:675 start_codon:yes stop_codon:yes gene_type:complete